MLTTIDLQRREPPLMPAQEGLKKSKKGTERLFEPWLSNDGANLKQEATGCEYKGLALIFKPDEENSRAETRAFFETPSLGLIVAPETSSELVPDTVYGHYGQFGVIIEEFPIRHLNTPILHRELLTYTIEILKLLLGGIDEDQFKEKCKFYIVPLRPNTETKGDRIKWEIDFQALPEPQLAMDRTFGPGDIVKRKPELVRQGIRDQHLLVRKLRHDLNPLSEIPNLSGTTFLQYLIEKNRISSESDCRSDQCVVELMDLSLKNADYNEKKCPQSETTTSIYILEDDLILYKLLNATRFFQIFCLSPIIYKILQASHFYWLDQMFLESTKHRRNGIIRQWNPPKENSRKRLKYDSQILSCDNILMSDSGFKTVASPRPPILFDRNVAPLMIGSRVKAMAEALTHKSAGEPYSLEFAEIVGDSFLKYVVSVTLFILTGGNEGSMTTLRSDLVSNRHFEYLAKRNNLGRYAITRKFDKSQLAYILGKKISEQQAKDLHYNSMAPKALSDIVEAIVGAFLIYFGQHEAILAMEWLYLGLGLFGDRNKEIFDEFHEIAVAFKRNPPIPRLDQQQLSGIRMRLEPFEHIIGHKFNYPLLLHEALTHGSVVDRCTATYERLEYLGDALLDYAILMTICKETECKDPGLLSKCKQALTSNDSLARIGLIYKFDLFVMTNDRTQRSELAEARRLFETKKQYEADSNLSFRFLDFFTAMKGLISDVVESVAAAIYLDSGCSMDVLWRCYYPMFKPFIEGQLAAISSQQALSIETIPC